MRQIPDSMDADVVEAIDRRLVDIEGTEGVAITWAVESGSRAWGFPSPDSDYDARFLYIRARDDYLSLWTQRDVIETPLDRVFDVNGWDLAKAIRLALKGNAAVSEWLRSPIVYRGNQGFRTRLLELVEAVSEQALVGRHYLHLGLRQLPDDHTDMPLKRVLYALRAAAAVRWLRMNSGAIPPMELSALLDEAPVSRDVRREIDGLVERKAETRELGRGEFPPVLFSFVRNEFDLATTSFESRTDNGRMHRQLADDFFRSELARWNNRSDQWSG